MNKQQIIDYIDRLINKYQNMNNEMEKEPLFNEIKDNKIACLGIRNGKTRFLNNQAMYEQNKIFIVELNQIKCDLENMEGKNGN